MSHRVHIAEGAQLQHGQTRVFSFRREGRIEQGFVLRHHEALVAFHNRCPHWGVELDLGDGRFYADDWDRIWCQNHGATFLPTTGWCDHGPCLSASLERFRVIEQDGDAWVDVPGAEPAGDDPGSCELGDAKSTGSRSAD